MCIIRACWRFWTRNSLNFRYLRYAIILVTPCRRKRGGLHCFAQHKCGYGLTPRYARNIGWTLMFRTCCVFVFAVALAMDFRLDSIFLWVAVLLRFGLRSCWGLPLTGLKETGAVWLFLSPPSKLPSLQYSYPAADVTRSTCVCFSVSDTRLHRARFGKRNCASIPYVKLQTTKSWAPYRFAPKRSNTSCVSMKRNICLLSSSYVFFAQLPDEIAALDKQHALVRNLVNFGFWEAALFFETFWDSGQLFPHFLF